MSHSLSLDPVFPVLQVMLLGLIAIACALWIYARPKPTTRAAKIVAGLRAATVGALAFLLLNPVMVRGQFAPAGKQPLLVLVDTSRSMAVRDVGGEARLDAVKRSLLSNSEVMNELQQRFRVVFFSFAADAVREDGSTFAQSAKPTGVRTCIGEALGRSLGSAGASQTGGVLLLSDGRNNGEIDPVEVARQAKQRRMPVFTVCVGEKTRTKDLAVVVRRPQAFAAPRQQVDLSADIVASGFDGRQVQVSLARDGKPVADKSITLSDTGHNEVAFPAKENDMGTYRYTVSVQHLPGEATYVNNRASVLLNVAKTTTRVLVLEGRPTWDAKFLVQALHSDPSIELDAIYKLTENRFFAVRGGSEESTPTVSGVKVPSTRAELTKYDVVMLGKGFSDLFDAKAVGELKDYVAQDGGHLVLLRGNPESDASTLADLEPITWTSDQIRDFRMKLTEDGLANPAFAFSGSGDPQTIVQTLPTLISATRVEQEKALSVVLARAPGVSNASQPNREMAVLAYQNYGQGIVVALVGQGLWRWALLPPQLSEYAHCYNDFWTQMIRWLVSQSDFLPGQNIALRTDHFNYSPGEAVNLTVFVRGRSASGLAPVRITGPDGRSVEVALSHAGGKQADYVGTFRPREAGDYVASLPAGPRGGRVTVPFGVLERPEEDMNTSSDPGLMKQIAVAGGGDALTPEELRDLPRRIQEAQALLVPRTESESVWDKWSVLALILALMSAEWIVRRRVGMV